LWNHWQVGCLLLKAFLSVWSTHAHRSSMWLIVVGLAMFDVWEFDSVLKIMNNLYFNDICGCEWRQALISSLCGYMQNSLMQPNMLGWCVLLKVSFFIKYDDIRRAQC